MPRKSTKNTETSAESQAKPVGVTAPAESPALEVVADAAGSPDPKPKRKAAAPKKTAAKKSTAKKKLPADATPVPAPTVPEETALAETAEAEALVEAHTAAIIDEALEPNSAAELQLEIDAIAAVDTAPGPEQVLSEIDDDEEAEQPEPRPPAKLERLQKILAQAGVASRRHAEELITEGRVQVNGQVVTTLGSKADPTRDHIRVDGKLLHGAERHRYFMLNKPKGYVTTVSDPEGRPTVMEFFKKAGERLYPVGRLDYLSEGLLLVTNDGDLANKLTRASSGVEKTYLVKVSGQPTEDEIESLREGVRIDRAKPGEGRVRTAPARIRQVRIGENPWYEVVLIEGRNRELRKMFEEIGHFVEKIRRVGYGPLVLDLEPGQLRELDAEELNLLRLAADGKWKPKKIKTTAMLPKEAGRTVDPEAGKKGGRPFRPGQNRTERRPERDDRSRTESRPERRGEGRRAQGFQDRGFAARREDRGAATRGRGDRDSDRGGESRGFGRGQRREDGRGFARPANRQAGREERGEGFDQRRSAQGRRTFDRPATNRGGFARPQGRTDTQGRTGQDRTGQGRGGQRPLRGRPEQGARPPQGERPRFERPATGGRPPRRELGEGFEERRPFRPRGERPAGTSGERPRYGGKPSGRGFGGGRGRGAESGGRAFGSRSEAGSTGRTERSGSQGRGQGGPRSGSGSRQGSNGSRPAFKGKPGGRRPSRGPGRGGTGGRRG